MHTSHMETTHSDIVRAAGKPHLVAKALGVSVHTVKSWRARNSIPADRWLDFVKCGAATFEQLAATKRPRGQ